MSEINHFKYSTTIHSHEADVRDICSATGGILTCSRDSTAKLWKQTSKFQFDEVKSFHGHKSFVSCIKFVPPNESHKDGLVITGGNDHKILVFHPKTAELIACLSGHANTVCSIYVGKSGNLLSASWDKTAKLWDLSSLEMVNTKCVLTYSGHNAAVWDVLEMPHRDTLIITASADRSIKLWKAAHCVFTLTDHSDCVRCLAAISSTEFLSCSNDTTVKRWSVEGNCLQTYYGHRSFVYSVSLFPNSQEFITAGEDKTIRVWNLREGHPAQTIPTPATSVWKAVCVKNGDVAGACSDGSVRIFTRSEVRYAEPSAKVAYEEELATSQLPSSTNKDLQNDVNLDELPGLEALQEPGKKDGQTILIKSEQSDIEVYQWSMADKQWVKVGNMVGTADQKNRKKTKYNGKEYDYLFTIDIAEGQPPLNLPYNVTEDPWVAAQKFIDNENLSQSFLETIANFIIENADVASDPTGNGTSDYVDPYTGGGRYVPGRSSSATNGTGADPYTGGGRYVPGSSTNSNPGSMPKADPFTGSGRYIPGSNEDGSTQRSAANDPMVNPSRYVAEPENMEVDKQVDVNFTFSSGNSFFPKEGFIAFETANVNAMLGKLKEMIETDGLPEGTFDVLSKIASQKPDQESTSLLWDVLNGNPKTVFPALDLFRLLLAKHPEVGKFVCHKKAEELLFVLLSFINPRDDVITANRLLAIRVLCNLALSNDGLAFLIAGYEKILSSISSEEFLSTTSSPSAKNIQIAVATLFVNYSVLIARKINPEAVARHCQSAGVFSVPLLLKCLDSHGSVTPEAAFRYLVALGTLLHDNDVAQSIARSLDAKNAVNHIRTVHGSVLKIKECSKHLLLLL